MPLTFITGPVRSGKSRFAVRLADESRLPVTFVATANTYDGDDEWAARLARHRDERPQQWATIEAATMTHDALLEVLSGFGPHELLIVDAVGTYVAARIDDYLKIAGDGTSLEEGVEGDIQAFTQALIACRAQVIAVSEQVGWDVVPERASARMFRDIVGRAGRRLALAAERSYLVVSGFALDLRAHGTPVE